MMMSVNALHASLFAHCITDDVNNAIKHRLANFIGHCDNYGCGTRVCVTANTASVSAFKTGHILPVHDNSLNVMCRLESMRMASRGRDEPTGMMMMSPTSINSTGSGVVDDSVGV